MKTISTTCTRTLTKPSHMARSICESPRTSGANRFHHAADRAVEYCGANRKGGAMDASATHGQSFLTPANARPGFVQAPGLGSCDAGGKPESGTHCRGK